MSQTLKDLKSAEDFIKKLETLAKHAREIYIVGKGGSCDFHNKIVCSCGKCEDKQLKCQGKPYHTRLALPCPLHQLAYEIQLDYRASKADEYIHPTQGKGHSNLLEASHNVFIRFRSKVLNLDRLHYETSTNLALLQANQTYMTAKHGPNYHWIPDLYRRLKLPVYDGLIDKIGAYNKNRAKT